MEEIEEWLSFVKNDKQWESTEVRDTESALLKHGNQEGLPHKPFTEGMRKQAGRSPRRAGTEGERWLMKLLAE